jgi:diadenosine tetraphosphate (Ap4A) HIT family hydrolase
MATGADEYNVLQNNGRLAHQLVDHVCTTHILSTSARDTDSSMI